MASPFSVFRRHQKVLLATLGLAAMISFVFLGSISQIIGERGSTNPVVVRTSKFGKISQDELRMMISQRMRVLGVLSEAMASGGRNPGLARQYLEMLIGESTEQSVVDTWLLARHAEQLGMVVTNQAINGFLRELTDDRVKPDALQATFKRHNFSDRGFFQAFRDEMLAMRLRATFQPAVIGAPPAERWDYFLRLNRLATIEVVPRSVDRFADQISDPDDATLKKFFDQYKDRLPSPESPDPGFREPHRINVHYFKAEIDKFTPLVTDQEIKEEYEKNQKEYDRREEEAKKAEKASESEKAARPTKAPEGEKPATEGQPPEEPPIEVPSTEKPATEKPSTEESATEGPATEKPDTGKPAVETPSPKKPATLEPAKKDGTSRRDGRMSASFVSLLQDSGEGQTSAVKSEPTAEAKQPETEKKNEPSAATQAPSDK